MQPNNFKVQKLHFRRTSNSIIKQEEIANMINRSLRTVKTRMNEMQEKGLIDRKKGKRNGEWIIL